MHFTTVIGVAITATLTFAKELPKNEIVAAELYDSGIMHERIMTKKLDSWASKAEAAALISAASPPLGYTKCVNGYAIPIPDDPAYKFKCKNMDLYSFISHADLWAPSAGGSGSWGWTDPESGREIVASGAREGTALIEITKEGKLVKLGFLPSYAPVGTNSLWHELRSYKNFMLIGSELPGHGIQIFDMTKILTVDPANPVIFKTTAADHSDLASHVDWLPIGRTHNVVVNEERALAMSVGAAPRNDSCGAGLIFIDLSDPFNPKSLGCDPQDGYVHDAQCLVYHGPDTQYEGRDICYGYNEDTLTIYDVTDRAKSTVISRTSYEGATYTHQGWVLDKNWQSFLLLDDEIDEEELAGPSADGYPTTYIWDISSLAAPKQTGIYKATNKGIDHNQFVVGDLSFQSSYMAGLRVYDVSSIPKNPRGTDVCEVAFFDIHPEDDQAEGGGIIDYGGTWSHYPFFKSGFVYINTMDRGGFVVKMTKRETCKKTCNADNCLRALRSTSNLAGSQEFCGEFTKTFVADVSVLPAYAASACTGNAISRVSSACACLPTPAGKRLEEEMKVIVH